jgi:hypothetical protein
VQPRSAFAAKQTARGAYSPRFYSVADRRVRFGRWLAELAEELIEPTLSLAGINARAAVMTISQGLVPWQQPEHEAPALGPVVIVLPSREFMHGQGERACLMWAPMQQPCHCLDFAID